MCTRERALELGQSLEVIEAAEKEIAAYEKRTWQTHEQDR